VRPAQRGQAVAHVGDGVEHRDYLVRVRAAGRLGAKGGDGHLDRFAARAQLLDAAGRERDDQLCSGNS
jgi:hypothetical protein